jgi:hypothetical protein
LIRSFMRSRRSIPPALIAAESESKRIRRARGALPRSPQLT